MIREQQGSERVEIGQFLVSSYVLFVIGLLDPTRHELLDSMSEEAGCENWKEIVRQALKIGYGIDDVLIQHLFRLIRTWMPNREAIGFLFRAFGCPSDMMVASEHPPGRYSSTFLEY